VSLHILSFWFNSEWKLHTHGTCSGLRTDAFFIAARSAYKAVSIPLELGGLKSQSSMSPDQIVSLFTASNPAIPQSSLAVSCGHNYLTVVEVCLAKKLHPVACPAVRLLPGEIIRVPSP